jgi:uncharacterized membrane protein HdeD (DUF308 family)
MNKGKKRYEYIWLHWISVALMFSAIMILVVETAIRHSPHYTWGWALYSNIPFIIVILIMLLSPLVGGIVALTVAVLWVIFWYSYAYWDGINVTAFILLMLQGATTALAGIVSIAFYYKNRNRTPNIT